MDADPLILELQATPEEVMRAVEALKEFCLAQGVAEKAIFALMLSLEEIASNVVNHAYQRDPAESFHVTFQCTEGRLIVEVRDHGPAFNPVQSANPTLEWDEEDRPEGGWGIQLVRHSMDDLQYTREGAENVLRMSKRINLETG